MAGKCIRSCKSLLTALEQAKALQEARVSKLIAQARKSLSACGAPRKSRGRKAAASSSAIEYADWETSGGMPAESWDKPEPVAPAKRARSRKALSPQAAYRKGWQRTFSKGRSSGAPPAFMAKPTKSSFARFRESWGGTFGKRGKRGKR